MGRRAKQTRRAISSQPVPNYVKTFERGVRVITELDRDADLGVEVEKRRQRLREVTAPIDAIHLLGQMSLSASFIDADTYAESTHSGQAYVVEMLAADLLTRSGRAGERRASAIDANVLDPIRETIAEATLLESFRRQGNAGHWSDPEGGARGRAAAQHLYLRSPGWWWQEEETLRGLFGEKRFADALLSELGFDCEQAIKIAAVVPDLTRERVSEWMENAKSSDIEFGPGHPAYDWAEAVFTDKWKSDPRNAAQFIPVVWALMHAGDACLLSPAEISERAEVEESAVAAYLAQLSLSFGQSDGDWFELAEKVRWRPYIESEGRYMLIVPGADLWALRALFERVLKKGSSYLKYRGAWLEKRIIEILGPAVEPDEVYRAVHFEGVEGEYPEGEIDVLLRFGSTALAIEAKSATMRPGARRGGEALISHLRENLTKATMQGEAARQALATGAPLTDAEGAELNLGASIREVQTILVSLDDLSAVAPVIWELRGTKTMPESVNAPWVLTLHELEQVAATTQWPIQLIHFLRRRSRLNEIGNQVATDELDWWMHYMLFGLYFEQREESRVHHTSLTDPLDQWFLFERGIREEPAPKPEMRIPSATARFLDTLCEERPPGWVEAGCAFLDADTDAQEEFWRGLKKLRKRARKRDATQRLALSFEVPEKLLFCALATREGSGDQLLDSIEMHITERFEELGVRRTLAIASLLSSSRPYDALVVLEPLGEGANPPPPVCGA